MRQAVKRRLKVGVQLPEVEWTARWRDLRDMARLCEDAGFDSLWVGDHLLYRDDDGARGPWEAWSVLSALAAVTERIELGPLVASTAFHNPAMLAKKASTVDEISGGRLVLGLGAGYHELEHRAYGFPFERRASRFEEAFTIIRTLLREGFIDFEGRYYQVRDCELVPRGPRPEGPPLMVGSIGERMLAITTPHVDAWNAWFAWFENDLEKLGPLLARVDAACNSVGRDPAEIERTTSVLVQLSGGVGRRSGVSSQRGGEAIRGSVEEIASALRAFADAGISHVQLVLDPITLGSIAEVAPVLAELASD